MEILTNIKQQDMLITTFGKPTQDMSKAKIRKYQDIFQLEYIIDNKAFHKNINFDEVLQEIQLLISDKFKECVIYTKTNDIHLFRNKKNEINAKLFKPTKSTVDNTHDRQKDRVIKDGIQAPFLFDLGICDSKGAVTDKGSKKFIQINRFLQILDEAFLKIRFDEEKLNVVDFCCGKGYLTFALYHYLKDIKKKDAYITGIDLKQDVIENLITIADKYAMKNIEFVFADITSYDKPVDIALGLHACDTATDIFLSSAVKNKAKLIISVPCCQHQLFKQMKNESLKPIIDYGLQKDRLTEMLTNTLRILALKSKGYNVDIIEFASLEHTMKNVLIRAIYTGRMDADAKSEYDRLKTMFEITEFEGDSI